MSFGIIIYDNFGTFRRVISSSIDLSFLKSLKYFFFNTDCPLCTSLSSYGWYDHCDCPLVFKKMECCYIWKKPWFYRREERLKNFFLFVLTFWGPFFSVSSTTTTSRVTSKKSIRTSFKAKMNYYSHNDSVFRGTHTIWWSYSAHSDLKSEKKLLNFPLFYSDEWGNSAQNDNLCVFWIILLWISIFAREK